jgi:hypothetical protein
MRSLTYIALSSALLLSPLAATGAFAQSTNSNATSNAPGTAGAPVPSKTKPVKSGTMMMSGPSNQTMAPGSQNNATGNPPGAQPGTGSGMGKASGSAAGN